MALPLFREHHKGAPLQRQERRAKVVGLKLHHTNRTRRRPVGERAFLRLAAIGFIGALALSLTNCGGKSSTPPPTAQNPVPSITSISPTSATAGGAAFTLTVTGTNFISGSVVRWGGASRTTTYSSSTQLTASISADDISPGGTVAVTVFNPTPGGGTSGGSNFTINNPVPTVTSLSPSSATAGSGDFTLTVNGTNFVNGSVVTWNGADRTTTFVNSGQLTASITAADIATADTAGVTVFNPAPAGGISNTMNFPVNNPVPTLSWLSPSSATAGGGAFTLAVRGTNFISGSSVRWGGASRTTTYVSSTQLTAATTAGDISSAGTVAVTVFNPAPGGGTSSALSFNVHTGTLARNETCSTATPISNGVTRASISPYGDVDVYSFHGTAGHQVTIEIFAQRLVLYGDPSSRDVYLDSFLELLSASCTQIAYNDDIDPGVMQDSLISNFTLTDTGTYYIRVSDLRGDGRPDFIYELHLSGAN